MCPINHSELVKPYGMILIRSFHKSTISDKSIQLQELDSLNRSLPWDNDQYLKVFIYCITTYVIVSIVCSMRTNIKFQKQNDLKSCSMVVGTGFLWWMVISNELIIKRQKRHNVNKSWFKFKPRISHLYVAQGKLTCIVLN